MGGVAVKNAKIDLLSAGSKSGRHNPVVSLSRGGIPVSRDYEKFVAEGGWEAVFSPKAWRDHPLYTGALFLNIAHGVSWGIARAAARRMATGIRRWGGRGGVIGMAEAIRGGGCDQPILTVKIPRDGGGKEAVELRISEGETQPLYSLLGRGIEVEQTGRSDVTLRPVPLPTQCVGEKITKLSVFEVASLVDAQYRKHDFCGEWERTAMRGSKGKGDNFALFVHSRTRQGVLVFQGTSPTSARDWLSNIAVTHGFGGGAYKKVLETARDALDTVEEVVFAGHSRGGGMAQYAAQISGGLAITFNSVGLPPSLRVGGGRGKHYAVRYDWVSNISGAGGDGGGIAGPLAVMLGKKQEFIGEAGDFHSLRAPIRSRYAPLELHTMDAIKNGLRLDPQMIDSPYSKVEETGLGSKEARGLDRATPAKTERGIPTSARGFAKGAGTG